MSYIPFFCFCLTAGLTMSSSLRILNEQLNCSQPGLDHCRMNNCTDEHITVPQPNAPNGPEWDRVHVGVGMDKHGLVPVLNVTWKIKSDASIFSLHGSEISILDESTNESMCVQFSFTLRQQLNPSYSKWMFSLDGVVVEPGHTYMVSVFNFPKPVIGESRIRKQITVPGCVDKSIQTAQMCLENGSLWDPHMVTAVSVDKKHKQLTIIVGFQATEYSERYQVSIESHGFHDSKNVSKGNRTSLNVTFERGLWQLSQCELLLKIQPFFVRCNNDCWRPEKIIDYCPYYPPRTLIIKATVGLLVVNGCLAYLLWRTACKGLLSYKRTVLCRKHSWVAQLGFIVPSAPVDTSSSVAKEKPEDFQVQERKRVLIIYSLDHPLYKNIVLKLCGFLATKCGTEVILDLLDSTRLEVLGSIQWLDWHRQQIENSSDKILILCSPGVQAKWKAICGDKQVFLRVDTCSPMGDMLTPALSLIVPNFIRSASFEKYIVAYFDNVCSEEDVPPPFNITVRYKLMKQFEELFFRILGTEKHQPGRVNHIKGLSEDEYHQCPSGRALCDAIEAFQAYQLEHPQWFEDELLESPEFNFGETSFETCDQPSTFTNLIKYRVPDFSQVFSHVKTQENNFTEGETALYVTEKL
ncbi:interleukin-17 receptor A isoform X1 [Mastacembelus armatus]|uniref:interleukin-17 receptor A isoform X1 n=2 Tax=Mastacembelus armatus TaxID=205130 RepID=UPI000E463D81|nr:interleukin-17 receptor A-like isoform X1 [Mastacembelus armatus]